MGVGALSQICDGLLAHGWAGDTPCAPWWSGGATHDSAPWRRRCEIRQAVDKAALGAPAIIIAGAVAGLREELTWFGPLFGLRVAITHARPGSDPLAQRLRALGADVYACATVEIRPKSGPRALAESVTLPMGSCSRAPTRPARFSRRWTKGGAMPDGWAGLSSAPSAPPP